MLLPIASGFLLLAGTAVHGPALILPGSVLDVAASPTTVVAVRERDVVLLAADGRVLARRTRPTTAPGAEPSSSGRDIVLGTRRGLLALVSGVVFREERQHLVELRGLRGRQVDLLQASPDGVHVVAGVGRRLLMSHDGGESFAPALDLPRSPRSVVVSPDGTVFTADVMGAWRVDHERTVPVLAGPIAGLSWCDEALVALAPGGAIQVVAPAARRTSRAPAAGALRCGSAPGSVWVLTGPGLWTSSDGGRSWSVRLDAPLPVRSAVELDGVLWVAAGDGLVRLPETAPEAGGPPPLGLLPGPPPPLRQPGWVAFLPRIELGVAFDERRTLTGEGLARAHPTRTFEVQLSLIFRLDRRWPQGTLTALARERLRQRALLALTNGGPGAAASALREATVELLEDLP